MGSNMVSIVAEQQRVGCLNDADQSTNSPGINRYRAAVQLQVHRVCMPSRPVFRLQHRNGYVLRRRKVPGSPYESHMVSMSSVVHVFTLHKIRDTHDPRGRRRRKDRLSRYRPDKVQPVKES